MGTNYYWKDRHEDREEDDLQVHIGKRSAAGPYCWDCGTTLCKDGSRYVHYTHKDPFQTKVEWFELCPSCGKSVERTSAIPQATNMELGFEKGEKQELSGISSCSTFAWTLMKHKKELQGMIDSNDKVVIDEYGRTYTAREFLEDELSLVAMEAQCPYRFC